LKEKISSFPWEVITIKLYGTFLEALILFANLSNKLKKDIIEETLEFLWNLHLPNFEKKLNSADGMINYSPIGDYVFGNHLIPGQFIVCPLNELNHKSQLILKYPAQKKKLMLFLNSKYSKIKKEPSPIPIFPGTVKLFMENFLNLAKNQNDYFFFKKSLPISNPDKFFEELENFISLHPSKEYFPKGHF
jgi:hypothetical protein